LIVGHRDLVVTRLEKEEKWLDELKSVQAVAAFWPNVELAEHAHQVPKPPIKASSNVPDPFLNAITA
jgi:hypothetical protein